MVPVPSMGGFIRTSPVIPLPRGRRPRVLPARWALLRPCRFAYSGAMNPLVAIEVPTLGDARRKNWAKVVESVDESKTSGWAFEGEFIATGGIQDVPVGSVVMVYGERGSRANPQIEARVFVANGDGTLTHEQSATGRAWARTLRDRVGELLADAAARPVSGIDWEPDLMRYSDMAILEEVRRRRL
jgi:hypothetical protein